MDVEGGAPKDRGELLAGPVPASGRACRTEPLASIGDQIGINPPAFGQRESRLGSSSFEVNCGMARLGALSSGDASPAKSPPGAPIVQGHMMHVTRSVHMLDAPRLG